MKKPKLLLLGALLASFTFSATAADEPFDPSRITATYNRSDGRRLASFKLTNVSGNEDHLLSEPEISVNQLTTSKSTLYYDRTSSAPFQTEPGNTVRFDTIDWNASWMHSYLFIDYNKDGGFNSKVNTGFPFDNSDSRVNNAITVDPAYGELVSFWVYDVGGNYYIDSYGRNVPTANDGHGKGVKAYLMPEFKIPEDLPAGTYDALFKIDWSDITQHGRNGTDNNMGNNGGVVVKFQIQVIGSHTVTVDTHDTSRGTVSLRVDGHAIEGTTATVLTTQSVVAVATPEANHYFAYWTDDATGQIVSRDLEYTVTLTGDVSLTANFLTQREYEGLDESFDPSRIGNYTRSNTDRYLTSFTLQNLQDNTDGEQLDNVKIQVDQPTTSGTGKSLYYDKTDQPPFVTRAGNTVKIPTVEMKGDWVHGYLFIDYNQDGGFNSMLNTGFEFENDDPRIPEALNPNPTRGELVSFNYYDVDSSSDEYFVNSHGEHFEKADKSPSSGNMPAFIIPSWVKPGIYDALYKHDWSNIDQHGNTDPGNLIGNNGGCIVRFQIKVEAPLFTTQHTATNTSYWNAAVITINYSATGVAEGEKLVAVATQTGATTVASTAAFTTLADDETVVPEDQDVIKTHDASNNGKTLKFNLDKDQNQAKLLLEQPTWDENGNKTDNFTPNTQYTYDIVLQTEDENGKVTGVGHPYSMDFTTSPNNGGNTAGVEDVTADDSNAPARYYNLQGIEVAQPAAGQIYIMRQGNSVKKVLVK